MSLRFAAMVGLVLVILLQPQALRLSMDVTNGPVLAPAPALRPSAVPKASVPPGVAAFIGVGSDLEDILMDPSQPLAYVADRQGDQILVISLATTTIQQRIAVGNEPVALALSPSGMSLYVGHAGEMSIAVIDTATLTMVKTLTTTFLTWDLIVPTEDTLIATTHDIGYTGQYPYVLRATDGVVLQRLNPGELVYMDFLATLTPDRRRAYLVTSALAPFTLYKFDVATNGTWIFAGKGPDFGSGSPAARDIVASPDGRWLYFGMWSGSVQRIATDRNASGPVGMYATASTVDVSPTSQFIAMSAGDAQVHLFDVSGGIDVTGFWIPVEPIMNVSATDRVWRLRVSPSGDKILMVIGVMGDGWQDLEILDLADPTYVVPISPVDYTNETQPDLTARVVTFRSLADLVPSIELDGTPLAASMEPSTGFVRGNVNGPQTEAPHGVLVEARRLGDRVAASNWTFTIDATPPSLALDLVPAVVETDSVTISGRITDANLKFGWIITPPSGPFYVQFPGPEFNESVPLVRGSNLFEVGAIDRAQNRVTLTVAVEFRPSIEWFVHPAGHFRIRIPWPWAAEGNVTIGGQRFDVLLSRSDPIGTITVTSVPGQLNGTTAEARALLQAIIADFPPEVSVDPLEPVTERTLDGHPAARVLLAENIVGSPQIIEILIVVVGAEWDRYWILSAATYVSPFFDLNLREELEAGLETFDVFQPEPATLPPSGVAEFLAQNQVWLLTGALLATAGEGAILGILIVRGRRRRSS